MELTKKQKELIKLTIETEKEINDQVYFRYNNITKKIYIIQIIKVNNENVTAKFLKPVNAGIARKLEEKGLLILKRINDKFSLLTLNKELL